MNARTSDCGEDVKMWMKRRREEEKNGVGMREREKA